MAKLESILHFLEGTFQVSEFPDYPHALNGLQVDGPEEVDRLAVAVDASEVTIRKALEVGAQLLIVHHGLFWDGFGPISGPRFRKVRALIQGKMALYSLHLPLDSHPELGNCVGLTRSLGLEPTGTFAAFKGKDIGVWATADLDRGTLWTRLEKSVEGKVRLIRGGPEAIDRVGVVTGSGAGALSEASALGLDALVTGEAAHQNFHEAMELGINLYLAGHYATETFGVKALADCLTKEFPLEWSFLDFPTGF